ncbi:MAG: arsenite methyltransferase [Polyangiaceae bacterium]
MNAEKNDQVRQVVREQYGNVARGVSQSCAPGCCAVAPSASLLLGYSEADLAAVPEGSNLGLGCGNPQALASLRVGETVLDLGSGAGFDCFLAAKQVGEAGQVIGVDMTAEMISKARDNASRLHQKNVEFRLGEIEHLPLQDACVDVILSNCVINLSPDKPAVFREAFRVLRPGGRLAISDVVRLGELPEALARDVMALTGCVAGAAPVGDLERFLTEVGFDRVRVEVNQASREFIRDWMPGSGVEHFVASASIQATKPGEPNCCAPSCCGGTAA